MTTRAKLAAICMALIAPSLLSAPIAEAAPSRAQVQQQLDALSRQIAVVDEDYNVARIDLAKVESRIRDARQQKAKADVSLVGLREAASARAAAMYKAGLPDVVLAFFGSKDPNDLNRRMSVSNRISEWQSGLVSSLEIAGQRSQHATEDLAGQLQKAKAINAALAAKRTTLEASAAEQQRLLDKLAAQEAAAARARKVTVKPRATLAAVAMPENLPVSGSAKVALQTAYAQIGKPYRWGAAGPDSFDCSGLMLYSWGKAGVSLPHSSRAQYSATPRVARNALQPGDLVFFGSPIHHVGMYVGNGSMINSPESGETVQVRSMDRRDYVGAGRPGV